MGNLGAWNKLHSRKALIFPAVFKNSRRTLNAPAVIYQFSAAKLLTKLCTGSTKSASRNVVLPVF
jgi:hypothetical protein